MAEEFIYAADIQRAINTNGGMHMAHIVGGVPCSTLCEVEGFRDLGVDKPFAYTIIEERVTCPACRMVNNARATGCL